MGWHTLPRHDGTVGWYNLNGAHNCFLHTGSARYELGTAPGSTTPLYLQPNAPVFVTSMSVLASWCTIGRCGDIFWTVWVNGNLILNDVALSDEDAMTHLDIPFEGELSEVKLVFRQTRTGPPEFMRIWVACARGYVPGVIADFEAAPLNGRAPLTVQFTDLSTLEHPSAPSVSSWTWLFGDGGSSANQNPEHVYEICPNEFDVRLTASNSYQSDVEFKPDYIETVCFWPRTYFFLA